MKKILFFACALLAGMPSLFSITVVDRPPFSVANTGTIEIESIQLSDTGTVLSMKAFSNPKYWFRMASETYLLADGEKKLLRGAEGLAIDKEQFTDETGVRSFRLFFPPIDSKVERFDFIESDCDDCFKILGVELKSNELSHRALVPQEALNPAAEHTTVPLQAPAISGGEATLEVHLLGYTPLLKEKVRLFVDNPVTGDQEEYEFTLDEQGNGRLNVPLVCKMQVLLRTSSYNDYIVLTPGQLSSVYFDLQAIWQQRAKLRSDRIKKGRSIYFSGANADLNTAFSTDKVLNLPKNWSLVDKEILGMTAFQYKDYVMTQYRKALDDLAALKLNSGVEAYGKVFLKQSAMYMLMFGDSQLEQAYRKANNLNYRDPMPNYVRPVFDQAYYGFIKELGINDPISLYSHNFGNMVNSCKYLNSKNRRISIGYITQENIEELRAAGKIATNEERAAAHFLKVDFNNWSKKKKAAYCKATLKLCEDLLAVDLLTEEDKKAIEELKAFTKVKNQSIVAIIENRIGLNEFQLKKNPNVPDSFKRELTVLFEQVDSSLQAEVNAFYQNHMNDLQAIRKRESEEMPKRYLAEVLGTNQGILFDVMQLQQLSRGLEQMTPMTDDQLAEVAKMSNPFWAQYLKSKNEALLARIEANKASGDYRIVEAPQVADSLLFAKLMKPYAGKVVLIDYWATWCAPCRSAMKQLEPYKAELKDKGVVFLYLTGPTSPLETWQNMIPGIHGDHIRLSDAQYTYLRKLVNSTGVPTYQIIGKDGKEVYRRVGFEGVAKVTGLLRSELAK